MQLYTVDIYIPIYDSSGVIVTLNVQFPSLIPHILCTCFGFCFLLPPIQIQSIWCGEDWSYEAAGCLSLPLPAAGIS